MTVAYIGIGSNLGDKITCCREASERMARLRGCRLEARSRLYRTEPVGVSEQDWYLNGVVALETELEAGQLLKGLLAIERDMGRVRRGKWGPRTIDLDILLFGADILDLGNLTVPHPHMHLRRFVLVPMTELAPGLQHPVLGKTMSELLSGVSDEGQRVAPLEGE